MQFVDRKSRGEWKGKSSVWLRCFGNWRAYSGYWGWAVGVVAVAGVTWTIPRGVKPYNPRLRGSSV